MSEGTKKTTKLEEGERLSPPLPGLIYKRIAAAMGDIGAVEKKRSSSSSAIKYAFRGIDDVYNALQPVLAKHKLFTVTNVLECEREEGQSKAGGTLFFRFITVRFTMFTTDGSSVEITLRSEAMDSGDKGLNKAMSQAHKYCLLLLFCIPTEEPKDVESSDHTVKDPKPGVKRTTTGAGKTNPAMDGFLGALEVKGVDERSHEFLVQMVTEGCKGEKINYKEFKAYLLEIQSQYDPPRAFVGDEHGHPSLSAGNTDDLRALVKKLKECFESFRAWDKKRTAQ